MPDSSSQSSPTSNPDHPKGTNTKPSPDHITAITIGNFDGVHLGHQKLINHARKKVGPQGSVIAMSFHPHPLTIVSPTHAPQLIESFQVRKARLLNSGVDQVVELTPTPELLAKDPESFLDEVIESYQPSIIVEGHDFHFGKRRSGTPETLKHICETRGIDAQILGPVKITLTDQSIVTASSSLTRWLINQGRVRDLNYLLGRPHELTGTVIQGQQLGRTINIPTINLQTQSMLPADGVYSGFATFNNQRIHAAINVGSRPTVQGIERRAEAHLLNQDGTPWTPPKNMPEYNWECTLQLVGWVRDQVKFDGIQMLQKQIRRDCQRICELLV